MIRPFNTSHCYAAFDRRLRAMETWARDFVPGVRGYERKQVASRLLQRFAELAVAAFVRRCADRFAQAGRLPADTDAVECDGLLLPVDGALRLAPRTFVRALAEFLVHWLHALAALLLALSWTPSRAGPRFTLVFGVGVESLTAGGSDARFLDFCRRGPITPLAGAVHLIVQASRPLPSSAPDRLSYARFPLFCALRKVGLPPLSWLRALRDHGGALIDFAVAVWKCPPLALLGRDVAYDAAAATLDRQDMLDALVLTNSNYSSQPLWMRALPGRRFRTHMVWYSQNSAPIVYRDDPSATPLPNFKFIAVDAMWVWTAGFRTFLETLGCRAEYHIVGPVLWHLPPAAAAERRAAGRSRIAVFDVTPITAERERSLGMPDNYFNAANASRFLCDIVDARTRLQSALGRPVDVILKHKRSYNPGHDPAYIALVERLSGQDGKIGIAAPDTNMYELIEGSDAVVVFPYSSPAYVAQAMGVPAIYYDSSGAVAPTFERLPGIAFAADANALYQSLYETLVAKALSVQ